MNIFILFLFEHIGEMNLQTSLYYVVAVTVSVFSLQYRAQRSGIHSGDVLCNLQKKRHPKRR